MSLASLSKGERFTELVGLIVRKVFGPRQGEPKNGQPGKMRQGLILTDGTAEMGFTLWGADVGTVMEGDQLTLRNGWVNAYTDKQGVEKLDLRLRKPTDGKPGWAKMGSGADIPQAPPLTPTEPQYTPVHPDHFSDAPLPSPAAQVVLTEMSAREANINKQSARRDAVSYWAARGVERETLMDNDVLAIARLFYRWAMNLGPHWMEDENMRKRFWAKLGEKGLSSNDAHRELAVYSMYDFEGTETDALGIILGSQVGSPPPTKRASAPPEGDAPTELVSVNNIKTAGDLWMAILANLKLNKSQALALVSASDEAEILGITWQEKYRTISVAHRHIEKAIPF